MARPLRITYEGAVYHVTIRGNERKCIFRDDDDRDRFVLNLAESVKSYGARLYLYCLMTNHAHLVLETPGGNLSRFMQRLQTAYTLYFNRKHNRNGHLMQGRFGASVVDEDEYILKLSRYVHLNPVFVKKVKALPVRERVGILRAYPWSSYRSYIGKSKPLAFVEYGPVLEMMDSDRRKRPAAYRRFVEAGISDIDAAFIDTKKQSRLCIGSESYNTRIDALYEDLIEGHACTQDVSFRRSGRCCSAEDVLSVVCGVLNIGLADLTRRQRDSMIRPLAARALCKYCGLTQRQVAEILNLSSGAAVSHQLKRLAECMEEDSSLRRKHEKISGKIQRLLH
jgi:REP element-mobilizing transposase RayT